MIFVLHLNELGPATAEAIAMLPWLLGCSLLAGDLLIPQLQPRAKRGGEERHGADQPSKLKATPPATRMLCSLLL